METRGKAKFETKSKMVDSRFTLSDETVFNQLKQKKNTTKLINLLVFWLLIYPGANLKSQRKYSVLFDFSFFS